MRPTSVDLHIEELVLRGIPAAGRLAVAAALEAELERLVLAAGEAVWAPSARPSLRLADLEVSDGGSALGAQLAAAIFDAVAAPSEPRGGGQ